MRFLNQWKDPMAATDPNELPAGTILETDDELRKIQERLRQQARQSSAAKRVSSEKVSPEKKAPSVSSSDEQVFRPSLRLPALQLTVYDDGETTGEVIRIRDERFTIGRTEGDLRFPNDDLISSRHVAITRQSVKGKYVWVLTDLQSRNGLFIRVTKAPLQHQAEFLIGSGRYRLESPASAARATQDIPDPSRAPVTQAFGDVQADSQEMLSEILRAGMGSR